MKRAWKTFRRKNKLPGEFHPGGVTLTIKTN
jgi:hypothetical protein